MRASIWLLLASLWMPAVWAVSEDLSARFASISDMESVPDGVVTALAQDREGFLWIGSTRGLIRFDGYAFRRYVHQASQPGSIGGNLIRSLLVARDGRLLIGTDADGLSVLDPQSGVFLRHRHASNDMQSIPAGAVMALAEDADGNL